MHYYIYSNKSAWISSGSNKVTGVTEQDQNFGKDEILELKKFFYDNSGNPDGYIMEYRFGKMYQGREKISYWHIDPKVLYYDKGELTKTEYISRETGEVIKDTRVWRMKRHMKRIG